MARQPRPLETLSAAYRRRIERGLARGLTRLAALGKPPGEHLVRNLSSRSERVELARALRAGTVPPRAAHRAPERLVVLQGGAHAVVTPVSATGDWRIERWEYAVDQAKKAGDFSVVQRIVAPRDRRVRILDPATGQRMTVILETDPAILRGLDDAGRLPTDGGRRYPKGRGAARAAA